MDIAMLVRSACAVAVLLPAGAVFAQQTGEEHDEFLRNFVVGTYAIVGRQPNGGAAYAGTADIARRGDTLVLTRKVGGRTTVAEGGVERAAPPADRPRVFNFRWTTGRSRFRMSCLGRGDFDNYARLTCVWNEIDGRKEPGLEAFFHRAAD